jgi:hypothetical protein
MIKELNEFFSMLDQISCWVDGTGVEHFPFQRTPTEFLEFAENDLKQKGPQAPANALANAKRALDCQLDYFLKTYGLSQITTNQQWATSKKISLMDDLGIVPQSIFHKINKARNDLEHRYDLPSVITAENSMDIVGIFVAATDLYLFPARVSTYYEIKEGRGGLAAPLLADLQLVLLEGDSIGAKGNIHGLSFDYQISSETDLNDYLYLLTFILHSHRINTPNANKFFNKLKYVSLKT